MTPGVYMWTLQARLTSSTTESVRLLLVADANLVEKKKNPAGRGGGGGGGEGYPVAGGVVRRHWSARASAGPLVVYPVAGPAAVLTSWDTQEFWREPAS